MVTNFPLFTPLELKHGDQIIGVTGTRPPYSDHNFTSLWSWNTDSNAQISHHNGNLLLLFNDYTDSNKKILTLLGSQDLHQSVREILSTEGDNLPSTLELIPEDVAQQLDKEFFTVAEDPSSNDYVYSVKKILSYSGNKYGAKRNFVNRFKRYYENTYCIQTDLSDKKMQEQILTLYKKWATYKSYSGAEDLNEFKALSIFLKNSNCFQNTVCIGLYDQEDLMGFAIVEIANEDYCIIHFEKADYEHYVGIYPYLMQKVAELANSLGCTYINYEQDLGFDFLKKSKKSYNPAFFLRKYSVSLK